MPSGLPQVRDAWQTLKVLASSLPTSNIRCTIHAQAHFSFAIVHHKHSCLPAECGCIRVRTVKPMFEATQHDLPQLHPPRLSHCTPAQEKSTFEALHSLHHVVCPVGTAWSQSFYRWRNGLAAREVMCLPTLLCYV